MNTLTLPTGQKARILDQRYVLSTSRRLALKQKTDPPLDRGFAGGGRNRPTVTSPKEYKNRFREAMDRYILYGKISLKPRTRQVLISTTAPNSWHQWGESKPPREQQKLEGN